MDSRRLTSMEVKVAGVVVVEEEAVASAAGSESGSVSVDQSRVGRFLEGWEDVVKT